MRPVGTTPPTLPLFFTVLPLVTAHLRLAIFWSSCIATRLFLALTCCAFCSPPCALPGKYLLVRDPNKPQLRLYAVPAAEELHYAGEAGAGADAADEE